LLYLKTSGASDQINDKQYQFSAKIAAVEAQHHDGLISQVIKDVVVNFRIRYQKSLRKLI